MNLLVELYIIIQKQKSIQYGMHPTKFVKFTMPTSIELRGSSLRPMSESPHPSLSSPGHQHRQPIIPHQQFQHPKLLRLKFVLPTTLTRTRAKRIGERKTITTAGIGTVKTIGTTTRTRARTIVSKGTPRIRTTRARTGTAAPIVLPE